MAVAAMIVQLARNWGWIVFRGVIAILFGVICFVQPGMTLSALVLLWGAYALLDGILAFAAGLKIKDGNKPMWPLLIIGLLGVAAGILTFIYPQITAAVLLAFIALWALTTGIFQIVAAIRFRKVISNEWLFIVGGLLSVAFGVIMILKPGAGALAVIWTIGTYAVLLGIVLVMFGFRVKSLGDRVPKPA